MDIYEIALDNKIILTKDYNYNENLPNYITIPSNSMYDKKEYNYLDYDYDNDVPYDKNYLLFGLDSFLNSTKITSAKTICEKIIFENNFDTLITNMHPEENEHDVQNKIILESNNNNEIAINIDKIISITKLNYYSFASKESITNTIKNKIIERNESIKSVMNLIVTGESVILDLQEKLLPHISKVIDILTTNTIILSTPIHKFILSKNIFDVLDILDIKHMYNNNKICKSQYYVHQLNLIKLHNKNFKSTKQTIIHEFKKYIFNYTKDKTFNDIAIRQFWYTILDKI
jgi:hypothetical protein